jgi:hypothetical protein
MARPFKHALKQLGYKLRRNRDKLVSLCGALILLTTFLVKDAYREYVKELSTRIDAAQTVYLLSQTNEKTYLEIRNFEHNSNADSEKGVGSVFKDQFSWLDKYDAEQRSASVLIDQTGGLLDRLQKQLRHPYIGREIEISEEMLKYENTWGEIQVARGDVGVAKSKNDEAGYSQTLGKLIDAIGRLNGQPTKLNLDARQLAGEVLRTAEEVRAQNDDRYKKATTASIVLYVVGWIVTIVGILSGRSESKLNE